MNVFKYGKCYNLEFMSCLLAGFLPRVLFLLSLNPLYFGLDGAFAAERGSDNKLELKKRFVQIKKRYKKAASVKMNFTKKTSSEFGFNKVEKGYFTGVFQRKNSLFRLEIPKKSILIFDGKQVWSVVFPASGFNYPPQVLKSRKGKALELNKFWSSIFGFADIEENFTILSMKWGLRKELAIYTLKPKRGTASLNKFVLKINRFARIIQELSYTDDLGNQMSYVFSNVRLTEKIKKDIFKFKIPEGSIVESF